MHITTVNLTGTVKRGLNSYSFNEEGIDDEIDGEEHAVHEAMAYVGEDSAAILLADWEVGGDV